MKEILKNVISRLNAKKNGYNRIIHKKGWFGFLEDGDTVFTLPDLKTTLHQVIDTPQNRPRGEKLFYLTRHNNFTIKVDKKPYRNEEALERLIIASNSTNFYNQIPIGGRKESIDIGIQENQSHFIFIELKPWTSSNSPLYAILESLKNLTEYQVITERHIKTKSTHYKNIELMILAPSSYYQSYKLIDEKHKPIPDAMVKLQNLLNQIKEVFSIKFSFMLIEIEYDNFLKVCGRLYDDNKVTKQTLISVTDKYQIDLLHRKYWKELVSSS
jgi:hypothetical protein